MAKVLEIFFIAVHSLRKSARRVVFAISRSKSVRAAGRKKTTSTIDMIVPRPRSSPRSETIRFDEVKDRAKPDSDRMTPETRMEPKTSSLSFLAPLPPHSAAVFGIVGRQQNGIIDGGAKLNGVEDQITDIAQGFPVK